MFSNNRRFLTIVESGNEVIFGLIGLKNAIYVDLQEKQYAKYSMTSSLELLPYEVKQMSWNLIEVKGANLLAIENYELKYINITQAVEIQKSIDKEDYGIKLIDVNTNMYYDGIKGWKKIIELHAIQ
jgi:hypothetical protein